MARVIGKRPKSKSNHDLTLEINLPVPRRRGFYFGDNVNAGFRKRGRKVGGEKYGSRGEFLVNAAPIVRRSYKWGERYQDAEIAA